MWLRKLFSKWLRSNRQPIVKNTTRKRRSILPSVETLEDRCVPATGGISGSDLVYEEHTGEFNDITITPGKYFVISDAEGVTQVPGLLVFASDFVSNISISGSVEVTGDAGAVEFSVGIGIGAPMIPYNIGHGLLAPSPEVLGTESTLANDIRNGLGRATQGVASAVAGVPVPAGSTAAIFHQVTAASGTLSDYRLYQTIVRPSAGMTETESNDDLGSANGIDVQKLVTGTLVDHDIDGDGNADADIDAYTFNSTIGANGRYAVIVDNDPDKDGMFANTKVTLLGPQLIGPPKELASNVSFGDANALVADNAFAGDYYVLVEDTGLGQDNDYRLVVIEMDSTADQVNEAEGAVSKRFNSGTLNTAIPDTNTDLDSTITVPGATVIGSLNQVQVTVNITHTNVEHLKLSLIDPGNNEVVLVNAGDAGTNKANFTNTTFSNGATGAIGSSTPAPFTGYFTAAGGALQSPQTGAWKLRIRDTVSGVSGTLDSWALAFVDTAGNNDPTTADTLAQPEKFGKGTVPSSFDADFYKVTQTVTTPPTTVGGIAAGDLVFAVVDTRVAPGTTNADQLDSFLRVFAADGKTVLAEDDNDGPAVPARSLEQLENDLEKLGITFDPEGSTFSGKLIIKAGTGNDTIDASQLNMVDPGNSSNTQTLEVQAGSGNDLILHGGSVNDLKGEGGDDVFVFNNLFAATATIDGGSGSDTLQVNGTGAPDVILAKKNGANLEVTVNGLMSTYTLARVEALVINGGDGDDQITIDLTGGAFGFTAGISVSGQESSDTLEVKEGNVGHLFIFRQSHDQGNGSLEVVGTGDVISFESVEAWSVTPFNNTTGAIGAAATPGRMIVFDVDPFEANNSILNATDFADLATHHAFPNIDGPGDEDWYMYRAPLTSTYQFDVFFETIATLANGNSGLPGDGILNLQIYGPSLALVTGTTTSFTGGKSIRFSAFKDQVYYLRVFGSTATTVNSYDVAVSHELQGPQVNDPDGAGPLRGVHITDSGKNEDEFDLFAPKPAMTGPTPLVPSITINIIDQPNREPGQPQSGQQPYPALDAAIAQDPGLYKLVGDHVGVIAITSITVTNSTVVVGQAPTATIELRFAQPLPDDRYTLTLLDAIVDPSGNKLDGDSNTNEPDGIPTFPSGDGQAGGNFVARFTVDSRPEIGTWASTLTTLDLNGNGVPDVEGQDNDDVNRDQTFLFGLRTDFVFAGNFSIAGAANASGFDKIGAYGFVNGQYRFLFDFNHDGVVDATIVPSLQVDGRPIAGNFNAAHPGDEVGIFGAQGWFLDTNGNNNIDAGDQRVVSSLRGHPIVGDFDGDGLDDLATYQPDNNVFQFDLAFNGYGQLDAQINFGQPGVMEYPVAADYNRDGIDDIGLWVPGQSGPTRNTPPQWMILVSTGRPVTGSVHTLNHPFNPVPFGSDLFFTYGDNIAQPLFANFDPPFNNMLPILEAIPNQEMAHGQDKLEIVLKGSDPDGDALSFSATVSDARIGVQIAGSTLTLDPPAAYAGSFKVTVSVWDGTSSMSRVFEVTIPNQAPTLGTIADVTLSRNGAFPTVALLGNDGDGDPLTYAAHWFDAASSLYQAYQYDQSLGLTNPGNNFHFNLRGANERYVSSTSGTWYFILPTGAFYKWNSSISDGTLLAMLDPRCWSNPDLLCNATLPGHAQDAYDFDQALGLTDPGNNYYANFRGASEKYFTSTSGRWYYILPTGAFYQWNSSLGDGTLLGTLDVAYWNDPSLLWNAQTPKDLVTLAGNQLSFSNQIRQMSGVFVVRVDVSDGFATASQFFQVTVTNSGPTLAALADVNISRSAALPTITLIGNDTDGDALTYSAQLYDYAGYQAYEYGQSLGLTNPGNNFHFNLRGARERYFTSTSGAWYFILPTGALYRWNGSLAGSTLVANLDPRCWGNPAVFWDPALPAPAQQAFAFDQSLELTDPGNNYYFNFRGASEKYFTSASGKWYFILPTGAFHEWNGSIQGSVLLGSLDPSYWENPASLWNAQRPADLITLNGNQLGFTEDIRQLTGPVVIKAEVSDGVAKASRFFKVGVTNAPPTVTAFSDLTITADGVLPTIDLNAGDSDGDKLTYAADVYQYLPHLAYELDQSLGLTHPGSNYYFNLRGGNEKYLMGASGAWYFLLDSGRLYRWNGSLNDGTLLGTLDRSYWEDPSLLWNAQKPLGITESMNRAHQLDQTLGLTDPGNNYYYNLRGANEKYFVSTSGQWYFILPSGALYRWTGSIAGSTLVGNLDNGYWRDPSRLWNAAAPGPLVSISGGQLTFTEQIRQLRGTFVVQVLVSDGLASTLRSFTITIV